MSLGKFQLVFISYVYVKAQEVFTNIDIPSYILEQQTSMMKCFFENSVRLKAIIRVYFRKYGLS